MSQNRPLKNEEAPACAKHRGPDVINFEVNHMTEHTEVNEKLNAGAIKGSVTVELGFAACNSERTPILAVRAGISAVDALDEAGCILAELKELLAHTAMQDINLGPAQLWLLFRNVELAKAVVDSVHEGLEKVA